MIVFVVAFLVLMCVMSTLCLMALIYAAALRERRVQRRQEAEVDQELEVWNWADSAHKGHVRVGIDRDAA
jgi:hypothetical protein